MFDRLQAALTIGLHIVGKHRVGQQGYMAEHIMEHIRFLKVVDLFGGTDEVASHKAAVGQMVEEHLVRHQTRNGHHLPAGQLVQALGQLFEIGNAAVGQFEHVETLHECRCDTRRQQL